MHRVTWRFKLCNLRQAVYCKFDSVSYTFKSNSQVTFENAPCNTEWLCKYTSAIILTLHQWILHNFVGKTKNAANFAKFRCDVIRITKFRSVSKSFIAPALGEQNEQHFLWGSPRFTAANIPFYLVLAPSCSRVNITLPIMAQPLTCTK